MRAAPTIRCDPTSRLCFVEMPYAYLRSSRPDGRRRPAGRSTPEAPTDRNRRPASRPLPTRFAANAIGPAARRSGGEAFSARAIATTADIMTDNCESAMRGAIAKLSDKQKDCLRLVLQCKTSKEIARELGISPHTVDRRLKDAIEQLGVSSRFEAARLLARCETCQSLACQPTALSEPVEAAPHQLSEIAAAGSALGELPGATSVRRDPEDGASLDGTGVRSLGPVARLFLIVAVALASALAFGAILAGLDALGRLTM